MNGHRTGSSDACEKHDPCQHGGICISTDDGPKCQCRDKNFEGTYCEIGTYIYDNLPKILMHRDQRLGTIK